MFETLLFGSATFWICLHTIIRWTGRSTKHDIPLPLTHPARPPLPPSAWVNASILRNKETRLTLRDIRLTITTTGLNRYQESIAFHLRRGRARRIVCGFYNTGAASAMVFTFVSSILLAILAMRLVAPLLSPTTSEQNTNMLFHAKRSIGDITSARTMSTSKPRLLVRAVDTHTD